MYSQLWLLDVLKTFGDLKIYSIQSFQYHVSQIEAMKHLGLLDSKSFHHHGMLLKLGSADKCFVVSLEKLDEGITIEYVPKRKFIDRVLKVNKEMEALSFVEDYELSKDDMIQSPITFKELFCKLKAKNVDGWLYGFSPANNCQVFEKAVYEILGIKTPFGDELHEIVEMLKINPNLNGVATPVLSKAMEAKNEELKKFLDTSC